MSYATIRCIDPTFQIQFPYCHTKTNASPCARQQLNVAAYRASLGECKVILQHSIWSARVTSAGCREKAERRYAASPQGFVSATVACYSIWFHTRRIATELTTAESELIIKLASHCPSHQLYLTDLNPFHILFVVTRLAIDQELYYAELHVGNLSDEEGKWWHCSNN